MEMIYNFDCQSHLSFFPSLSLQPLAFSCFLTHHPNCYHLVLPSFLHLLFFPFPYYLSFQLSSSFTSLQPFIPTVLPSSCTLYPFPHHLLFPSSSISLTNLTQLFSFLPWISLVSNASKY